MRVISATEASRSFASLLDGAERGERVVVTRGGRRVAMIGPATAGNGRDFVDIVVPALVDLEFSDDVRSVRELLTLDEPAWHDD